MNCKDCYHCDVCHLRISLNMDYDEVKDKPITEMEKRCEYFKNKSRIIELPCKVGTKVYVISSQTSDNHNLFIFEDVIDRYIIDENGIIMCFTNHLSKNDYRNKWDRIFTDKAKAEAKLKELNNGTT